MIFFISRKRILFCHFSDRTGADPVFSVKPLYFSVKNTDLRGITVYGTRGVVRCVAFLSAVRGGTGSLCCICIVLCCHIFCHLIGRVFRTGLQSYHFPAKTILLCGNIPADSLPQAVLTGSIIGIEDQIRIICSLQQFFLDFFGGLLCQDLSFGIKTFPCK